MLVMEHNNITEFTNVEFIVLVKCNSVGTLHLIFIYFVIYLHLNVQLNFYFNKTFRYFSYCE